MGFKNHRSLYKCICDSYNHRIQRRSGDRLLDICELWSEIHSECGSHRPMAWGPGLNKGRKPVESAHSPLCLWWLTCHLVPPGLPSHKGLSSQIVILVTARKKITSWNWNQGCRCRCGRPDHQVPVRGNRFLAGVWSSNRASSPSLQLGKDWQHSTQKEAEFAGSRNRNKEM